MFRMSKKRFQELFFTSPVLMLTAVAMVLDLLGASSAYGSTTL